MAQIVCLFLVVYMFVLLGRALLSWFPISGDSPLAALQSALYSLTEPILAPVRGLVPPMGGFDISFIIVVFGVSILRSAICGP